MKTRTQSILAIVSAAMLTGVAQSDIVLFAGAQGVIQQLDTETGEVTFRGICGGPVTSMVVHDSILYLGENTGVIYTFDMETNLLADAFVVDSDANAMSAIGDQLVIADSDGEVSYFDTTTFEIVNTMTVQGTDITAIGFDAGGIFTGGFSSLAMRSHIGQNNFEFFAACGSMINSMAFGPEFLYIGGIAFSGSETGTVYVFNKFAGGSQYYAVHAVNSDANAMVNLGDMLYIAGSDGVIHEMNTRNGVIERTFNTGIDIQAMTPESGHVSCPADYDASGDLNFLDISLFIDLFTNQLAPGDTNGDGLFNFFDISEFLRIYRGGC